MFDVTLVRRLCQELAREQNDGRIHELASLLRDVLDDNHQEIRLKALYMAKAFLKELESTHSEDRRSYVRPEPPPNQSMHE